MEIYTQKKLKETVFSHSLSNLSIHLLFLTAFIITFFDIFNSILKTTIVGIVIYVYFVVRLITGKIYHIDVNKFIINGFYFFLYLMITLNVGYLYGYKIHYILTNAVFLLPCFIFLFHNNFEISPIRIILFYVIVSALLSIGEYFLWEKIFLIRRVIENSINTRDETSLYALLISEDGNVRAFGLFQNALINGSILVLGLIIAIEYFIYKKKLRFIFLSFIIIIAIFLTGTRNCYFMTASALIMLYVVHKYNGAKLRKMWWFFSILLYFAVIAGMFFYLSIGDITSTNAYSVDSLLARGYSWAVIVRDYIISADFLKIIFGHALTTLSSSISPEVTYWNIDNAILQVYLNGGLIGIILYFRWLHSAVNAVCPTQISTSNIILRDIVPVQRICYVALSTYFLGGAMNANAIMFPFVPVLLVLCAFASRRKYNTCLAVNNFCVTGKK